MSDYDTPIIIGLCGLAGVGKTVTAKAFAPDVQTSWSDGSDESTIVWHRVPFAMPLYEMANTIRSIEGSFVRDRIKYSIYEILLEIFGRNPLHGAPPFDALVALVEQISALRVPQDGKPREFLQQVGTEILRQIDNDWPVKWMHHKIKKMQREHFAEARAFEEEHLDTVFPQLGVVIDDCRFPNEADYIRNHPRGVLIKLTAKEDTRIERLRVRDGSVDVERLQHASEQAVQAIPDDWFADVVDTTSLTIDGQAQRVRHIASKVVGF